MQAVKKSTHVLRLSLIVTILSTNRDAKKNRRNETTSIKKLLLWIVFQKQDHLGKVF